MTKHVSGFKEINLFIIIIIIIIIINSTYGADASAVVAAVALNRFAWYALACKIALLTL